MCKVCNEELSVCHATTLDLITLALGTAPELGYVTLIGSELLKSAADLVTLRPVFN